MKRIAVLTGKRGGYGAMKPMLRLIRDDPECELLLILTDQHLNETFGATISEVAADFEIAATVDMRQVGGAQVDRGAALGRCLSGMAEVFDRLRPDILVLYGDRGEVLAAATAAITLNVPIGHVQGGDISGNSDEFFRHAVTKLSHLHFPASEDSAKRIYAMGEEGWRIHVVGDNHVDPIMAKDFTDAVTIRTRYGIEETEAPILVLFHPETTRARDNAAGTRAILNAVLARRRRTIVVYPCSDPGYEHIVAAIHEYEEVPGLSIHRNIEARDFAGLMAIAGCMIGNSSAGLIETPYHRIPAINVGQRQRGRARSENVIDCESEASALAAALTTALEPGPFRDRLPFCRWPFGDGRAGQRIYEVLKATEAGPRLFDKRMTY